MLDLLIHFTSHYNKIQRSKISYLLQMFNSTEAFDSNPFYNCNMIRYDEK